MEIREAPRRRVVTVLCAVAVAGCAQAQEEEDPGPVSDEAYVQVMTDLMLLDADPFAGSTEEEREAQADSARRDILAGQGVTAREILDFAESRGGEAGRMEGLWQQITQRYDSARIANLDRETEARSEPEGKLGEEARTAVTRSSPGLAADSVAGADRLKRPAPRDSDFRSRFQRPVKGQRPARDTTVQQD